MSKRDFERKQREEQEATAFAFQEFIQTFQDNSGPPNKLFVKSGILYAKDKENEQEKGKIYNPKPILRHQGNQETIKKAIECATLLRENRTDRSKCGKPKSNLELLKEELRQRHLERDERLKIRSEVSTSQGLNCLESDDASTTNLFVANINANMTEQDLMKIFGVYGPLASVKIMWPRNDERGRSNVGFVAYMSRKDGERALECLKNRDDMRIGWAKAVELPQHPVYIPPELLKLLLPPPQSGLPFNAQVKNSDSLKNKENIDDILKNAYVIVTIPLDKKVLVTIHRMVEFVVKEGPLFEAMIMNKEINNTMYQFLFDNKSPNHIYYRWKLYSVLNGESVYEWSTKEFRMFKNGSIWVPPVIPNYTLGMPDNLIKTEKDEKKTLSQAQRNRLINYIQGLSGNRLKIGEAMIFCINHEAASKDITLLITESFENATTSPLKKIARLYLISDILYNSHIKRGNNNGNNRICYIEEFKSSLSRIFEHLLKSLENLKLEKDKEALRVRILKVIRSWDIWKIYSNDYLKRFEKMFIKHTDNELNEDSGNDEPLDGQSLIKRSLKNDNDTSNTDVTILPTALARRNVQPNLSDFIQSKWESVNPQDIEAQAMSTKQIYNMELERQMNDLKSQLRQISEEQRGNLRKIEVMVMQYQDELESGKRKRRKERTVEEEVSLYRKQLLEKCRNEEYKIRKTSPVSSDSFSSDEDKRECRRKRYGRKDRRDKYKRHKKQKDSV